MPSLSNSISIGRASGIRLAGGGGLVYLLRDDFTTAASAPLTSPRSAEPGPGTLTLVQTDGEFSIAAGKLSFPAQATPVNGDLGFYGAALARQAGRAMLGIHNFSAVTSFHKFGWHNAAAATATRQNFATALGELLRVDVNGTTISTEVSFSLNTDLPLAVILRSAGAFYLAKIAGSWVLAWVDGVQNTASLYPAFGPLSSVGTLDTFRVLDLPSPFTDDYGLATQRLAGARTAGDTLTHTADFLMEFTVTPAISGVVHVAFRQQDTSNLWFVWINTAGDMRLYEKVAGVDTLRGSVGAGVSSGHRVVIVCDGSTIRVYSNNTLRITYSSASNFATATTGRIDLLQSGAAVSDWISWPRQLTGQAAALLDAAVA